MGGIDGLVFTAGIGENAAPVRANIGSRLSWLGVAIDAATNARHGPLISSFGSAVTCYVIPTNEELMIAASRSGVGPALSVIGASTQILQMATTVIDRAGSLPQLKGESSR